MTKYLSGILLAGLLSGLIVSFLLKGIEHLTGHKVYTLLLNVDYIPFVSQFHYPEWIEVSFHLIISMLLSGCVLILVHKLHISKALSIQLISILVCLLIGAALYPTTSFSDRTPPVSSMAALFYWLAGHIVYGWTLGLLLSFKKIRFTPVSE